MEVQKFLLSSLAHYTRPVSNLTRSRCRCGDVANGLLRICRIGQSDPRTPMWLIDWLIDCHCRTLYPTVNVSPWWRFIRTAVSTLSFKPPCIASSRPALDSCCFTHAWMKTSSVKCLHFKYGNAWGRDRQQQHQQNVALKPGYHSTQPAHAALEALVYMRIAHWRKQTIRNACTDLEKFNQYTFGRQVTVITDHKPLVSTVVKPLMKAPRRLQSLLLRCQKYDYTLQY